MDEVDTENMNPEEIYNSIKKTSADIQNLSKLDSQFDDLKKVRDLWTVHNSDLKENIVNDV